MARIDGVIFTGSTEVGRILLRQAADQVLKCSMELGGNAPFIVFDDADLDLAVPMSLRAIFGGNGQVCLSGTRLLVQNSIREEFLERFTAEAAKLVVGDPKRPDTFMGPLIEEQHLKKVHGYVELAQEEGGKVVVGGERREATHAADGPAGFEVRAAQRIFRHLHGAKQQQEIEFVGRVAQKAPRSPSSSSPTSSARSARSSATWDFQEVRRGGNFTPRTAPNEPQDAVWRAFGRSAGSHRDGQHRPPRRRLRRPSSSPATW